jgi:acetylornithine deacetylase/succinyl-diaminopimelate desuccinylase-like protein
MDLDAARALVGGTWQSSILPALERYIAIPAKSPAFDGEWQRNGHLDGVVALAAEWVEAQHIDELRLDVVRLPGRTPVLLLEAPGDVGETVLLYGHLDKQPEMSGWAAGLGPWTPVRRGDRLYGRGGADDGYAVKLATEGTKYSPIAAGYSPSVVLTPLPGYGTGVPRGSSIIP